MVTLTCPKCGKALKAKDAVAGREMKCPECGSPIDIPELPTDKQIVERLDAVDNAKRFYRYALVAGVPASRYTGTIEVKPKGNGCVAGWRVDFLANNQPDIVVRAMVSTLVKTGLGSLKHRFGAAA